MKNNRELLYAAWQGYSEQCLPITVEPYIYSSDCWLAYRAGNALAASGRSHPIKCAKSRGYSVKLETAGGNEFIALFNSDLSSCEVKRK